jgi:hypothetical protein
MGWLLALAVLISLGAAVVSLSAPSLRPVVRDAFATYIPDVPQRYVDFLVGQSRDTVEVDLAALDDRIAALRNAIQAVAGGAATEDPEMARFLTGAIATGSARRIIEDVARLEAQLAKLQTQQDAGAANASVAREGIAASVKALEESMSPALGEIRSRQETDTARSSDSRDGLSTRIDAVESAAVAAAQEAHATLGGRIDAGVAAAQELDDRLAAAERNAVDAARGRSVLGDRVGAAEAAAMSERERLDGLRAKITAQADAAAAIKASVAGLTMLQINKLRPLLVVMHLRNTVAGQRPYAKELNAVEAAIGGDGEAGDALAVLRDHADNGVRPIAALARLFEVQSKTIVTKQQSNPIKSLTDSVANWLGATFKLSSATRSDTPSVIVTMENIAVSLRNGQLDMALAEAEELNDPRAFLLLKPWRAQTRARLDVDNAVAVLEAISLDRASADS